MFAVELYINNKFKGFLKEDYIDGIAKDIREAFIAFDFNEAKENVKLLLDKTDFGDVYVDYKIVEFKIEKIKEYIPKSISCFNEDFEVSNL